MVFTTIVIALSKWVGPFYLHIGRVVLVLPLAANDWIDLVDAHGWSGALTRTAGKHTVMGVIILATPLILLVSEALARLETVYVITDRRVFGLIGGARPETLWEVSRLGAHDLRFERTWRSPAGHLVVGTPGAVRRLHLRDDDPARVLAGIAA